MEDKYKDIIGKSRIGSVVKVVQTCEIGKLLEHARVFSDKVLHYIYGKDKVGGENIVFPIAIRKLAEILGISIWETNLNVDMGFQIRKVNGYIKCRGMGKWEIYVDVNDSESVKRYIIAHEISHFFISLFQEENRKEDNALEQHSIDPLFSQKPEELLADMLTSFLLFPPPLVLGYLKSYTKMLEKRKQYPMDSFEWLKELGQKAFVSSYFTIISYQYIKLYLCRLYQLYLLREEGKGLEGEIGKEIEMDIGLIEEYTDFFR